MSQPSIKAKQQNEGLPAHPEAGGSRSSLSSWQWDALCWLGLLVAGALLYGHTLQAPWYLDDTRNIVENSKIRDLTRAFGNFFSARGPANFTFALNYHFGGLSRPGFHLTNIAIHIVTSGLVYLVAKRVFVSRRSYAALAAAVFLAHPLQTQAVTYIVQRMASLSACFGFLCLYLFIRARERLAGGVAWSDTRHLCWWGGAWLACLLAVYTKQNLAILPLAVMLFDHFYLSGSDCQAAADKPGLLYVAPLFIPPLIVAMQQLIFPLAGGTSLAEISSTQGEAVSPLYYLVTEFSVIWLYIKLLFIPYPQLLDYIYPVTKQLVTLQNAVAFLALVALLVTAFLARRKYPHLSFGICWFLLGLAVESTLIPLDPVFEHRVYLSMFGFAVFLVGGTRYFLSARTVLPILLSCLLVFGGLTWKRNQLWNDDLSFYLDNSKYVEPDEGFLIALSKRLIDRKRYDEAIAYLVKSYDAGAKRPGIYVNLATSYRLRKEPQKAIAVIEQAVARNIKSNNLDIVLAQAYRQTKDYEKSLAAYRRVLEKQPGSEHLVPEFAMALVAAGRLAEAEPYLQRALQRKPDDTTLMFLLAQALVKRGALAEAQDLLRKTVAADPAMKDAWFSLGVLGWRTGNETQYRSALAKLEPLDRELAAKLTAVATSRRQ